MSNKWILSILSLIILFIQTQILHACTDIKILSKDGTVLIARSMEFGLDLNSNVRAKPQGTQFNTVTTDGKQTMSWKGKYGYVYTDGINVDLAVDGMNEKGLSFEYLLFPQGTEYQKLVNGKEKNAIPYYYFGDWILSNFATVDEVKEALKNIIVFEGMLPNPPPQLKDFIFNLHAAIQDKSGKSIVVEFIKGEMKIYDNNVGVLTNCPEFPWHVTNINNYLNLSPYTPEPIIVKNVTYAATGQGTGMLGLPGDISPPSRFIKMSTMLETARQVDDGQSALNLAQHLINNVDIPKGFVRVHKADTDADDLTQWVVFKDLKNNLFYFRTYDNLTIRKIDLSKINFKAGAKPLKIPMIEKTLETIDFTDTFLSSK